MRYAAIIIDNRVDIAKKAIEEHKRFIPKGWQIINIVPNYKTMIDYNKLLTNPSFWDHIEYDRVLIFQHDSGLLKSGIEEFLQWDYIGAWIEKIPGCMNGGLSIRNPKVMYEICVKHPYRGMQLDGNEDIYFCNRMNELGYKLPDKETCNKFSVETEFEFGSLGYHAIDKYHKSYKLILNQYESN
jgi:hypothetical protein